MFRRLYYILVVCVNQFSFGFVGSVILFDATRQLYNDSYGIMQ